MLTTLLTGTLSYLGTTADYFLILLLLFARFQRHDQIQSIVIGAFLGNGLLLLLAWLCAAVLKTVPADWVLGFLGLVPIIIAVNNYFGRETEDEGAAFAASIQTKPAAKIVLTVVLMTISSCGADNLALYIPYFSLTETRFLPMMLLIFVFILMLAILAAHRFAHVVVVQRLMDRFGEVMQFWIYLLLGCYILLEAGTIPHLLSLL
ncbi:cadmium resistance transporter [Leuconostocaceae bacterium ESL0958]|nr:cadmium resistance transporter [Leuconostocaceae bacterium ESL0958]